MGSGTYGVEEVSIVIVLRMILTLNSVGVRKITISFIPGRKPNKFLRALFLF